MRVMVMVKATKNSEANVMPSTEMLTAMNKYNEELVKAGIMVDGGGLHASSRGKRIRFADGKKSVIDGPFPNTTELVAGYWIWEVKSMDEAVDWALRCPSPMPGEESELEIRPFLEPEDLGEAYTPELRESEERMRAEVERRHGGM